MTLDHETQQANITKAIEHLEIAKSYCELAWSCAADIPDNALLADFEPAHIEELIENAKLQLSYVGGKWESIECSVFDDREF